MSFSDASDERIALIAIHPLWHKRRSRLLAQVCTDVGFDVYCRRDRECVSSVFVVEEGAHWVCEEAFNVTGHQMRRANEEFQR